MMPSLTLTILCLVCWSMLCTVEGTPCSATDRANDENACLQKVKEVFQDRDRFWFGYSYATRCPAHLAYTIDCRNGRGYVNDSIASILFPPGNDFDPIKIDRYLDLKFISKSGEYTGCGHHYARKSPLTIEIDPLSQDTVKSWDARDVPEMNWRTDPDKQYTLAIQDVGSSTMHGLYINIPGNDLAKAEVIKEYKGPLNMRDVPNPHAFILYEQDAINSMAPTYAPIDQTDLVFSLTTFANLVNLKGPIAINWISASFDPYSVQAIKDAQGLENCATFISQAMQKENLPFIKATHFPLNTYMEVNIAADALDFTFCCQDNKLEAGTVTVDPIGNSIISTAATRTNSTLTFKINRNKINANVSADFKNSYVVVMLVDPDVPFPMVGTIAAPLLHYLAYNFQVNANGELVNGATSLDYGGPLPPDDVHRYVFMLFFQSNKLNSLQSTDYTGSCADALKTRCLFDVEKLKTDNQLTLISATFFRATRDAYVAIRRNDTDYCDTISGGNPCDTKGSTSGCDNLSQTITALLLTTTVGVLATYTRRHH